MWVSLALRPGAEPKTDVGWQLWQQQSSEVEGIVQSFNSETSVHCRASVWHLATEQFLRETVVFMRHIFPFLPFCYFSFSYYSHLPLSLFASFGPWLCYTQRHCRLFLVNICFFASIFLSIFFPVHASVKRESYYSAENFHGLLMCGPCFAGTHLAFNVMMHAGEAAAYPFSNQSFLSAAYRLVYRRRTVADPELQSKSGHNTTSALFLMSVLDPRAILSTLHGCACSLWRGLLELQREHTLSVDITPALLSCHFSPCSWVSVLAVCVDAGTNPLFFFPSGNEKRGNHKA